MKKKDFELLTKAIEFYEKFNVEYIELDWTVPQYISELTKPEEKRDFFVKDKVLVGSGEQSFIELMINGKLDKNKIYMGVTPCFRDDVEDELHQTYFTKLELFSYGEWDAHQKLLWLATQFHAICLGIPIAEMYMGNSTDIVTQKDNIELGSYLCYNKNINGIDYKWSCGTGIAIPRIHKAI